MLIVQGDNGYTVPFNTFMDLTDASVSVVVQRGSDLLNKTANIIDDVNGKCELPLLSSDLTISGIYRFQWTASYTDGRIKSGKQNYFYVNGKLVGGSTPDPGGDITVSVDGGDLG